MGEHLQRCADDALLQLAVAGAPHHPPDRGALVRHRAGRTDSVAAGEALMISVGTPRASISRARLPTEWWQV